MKKIYKENKKKVYFMLQYSNLGSSSKYRVLIYKSVFDKRFITKYDFFWNNDYVSKYMNNKKRYCVLIIGLYFKSFFRRIYEIFFIIPKYDVLFIQRCIIPYLKPTFLNHLKYKNVKVIYDIDDALHLDKNYNCNRIAKLSDCVICGSDTLMKHYRKINSNIVFIPTVDDNRLYMQYKKNTFNNKCIGWIGSNSTIKNLDIVVKCINQICDKYDSVYVKVISDCSNGYNQKFKHFKFVQWSEETYLKEMSEFTIGIMPLIDNDFNRGKCGFKLVQYLDLGKPVIASDCGENKNIVKNYGFICNSDEEWYVSLEKMLTEQKSYEKFINNIEHGFEKEYGFLNTAHKICEIIEENQMERRKYL